MKFARSIVGLLVVVFVTSCSTLMVDQEARDRVAELESRIDTIDATYESVKEQNERFFQAFEETQVFLEELAEEGGFPDPFDAAVALLEAAPELQTVATESAEAIEQAKSEAIALIEEASDNADAQLHAFYRGSRAELEDAIAEFETTLANQAQELTQMISDAESDLNVSIRGFDERFDEYTSTTTLKLDTYFSGIRQEIEDLRQTVTEELANQQQSLAMSIRGVKDLTKSEVESSKEVLELTIRGYAAELEDLRTDVMQVNEYLDVIRAVRDGIEFVSGSIDNERGK